MKITDLVILLRIPQSKVLHNLPYGIILSVPFIACGIMTLIWNVMGHYEIDATRIRLLTGYLSRKEQFVPLSDIYEISFKQNLLEAPFRIGTLMLKTRNGSLDIRGVYRVRQVVEDLRKKASYY